MTECTRRVPWLDLLPKHELDLGRIFLWDVREHRIVNSVKHLGGEGADIVKVELDSMDRFWRDVSGVRLTSKLWGESHDCRHKSGQSMEIFCSISYSKTKLSMSENDVGAEGSCQRQVVAVAFFT